MYMRLLGSLGTKGILTLLWLCALNPLSPAEDTSRRSALHCRPMIVSNRH